MDERARHALALQVSLDRAGFSPGPLDATLGGNTSRALQAFRQARGLPGDEQLDAATVESLGEAFNAPVVSYSISTDDVAGPFTPDIPSDMMEKSKLPSLGYSSVLELLAERFHASPRLLQRLNPHAQWTSGEEIVVPNVEPFTPPSSKTAADKDAKGATSPEARKSTMAAASNLVTVDDSTKTLMVQNAGGETIFHAPVTTGSINDPLPIGEWKVNGVGVNPPFNYNPDLFWDADPSHAKAKIAAGPNGPVGVVWIDLSKEHYGIHGTPEPSRIGYTESHGCIRLTNWDAMRLASLVGPGTRVVLK